MVDTVAPIGADTKDPSTVTPPPQNDVGELLRIMEQSSKAFVRTVAVLTSFGARINAIEKRLTVLEGEGVTDEMDTPAPTSSKRMVRGGGST